MREDKSLEKARGGQASKTRGAINRPFEGMRVVRPQKWKAGAAESFKHNAVRQQGKLLGTRSQQDKADDISMYTEEGAHASTVGNPASSDEERRRRLDKESYSD